MIITVPDTNATGIHMALVKARHNIGVASSMVFTMIVVADLRHYDAALEACQNAGREHPSRIILVTNGQAKADRVDAEIRLGEEVPGEVISLKFHGQLTEHRDSVVLPLLTQHFTLLQRNLLYTAVTRARQLAVLTGDRRAIAIAVKNNRVAERYTGLARRLKGL